MTRRDVAKTARGAALIIHTCADQAPRVWASQTPRGAGTTKPNIVLMLTDKVGYGELGVYGGGVLRGAPTPRIDKLASEGMRLLNFNVEAQCTPSRSARMTAAFPSALALIAFREAACPKG
jgi:arylsulfatase A-like enzyme